MVPGPRERSRTRGRAGRRGQPLGDRAGRRIRARWSVPDHTSTPCSTAAPTTVRSASSPRSWRSRPCAARRRGPRRPLAVGCMVDEEGPRFDAAIFGSRMLCRRARRSTRCSRASIATATHARASSRRHAASRRDRSPTRLPGSSGSRSGSRCTSSRASRSSTCPAAARGRDRPRAARALARDVRGRGEPRRHDADGRSSRCARGRCTHDRRGRAARLAPSRAPSRRSAASRRARGEQRDSRRRDAHARRARARRRRARTRARRGLRGRRRRDGVRGVAGAASRATRGRSSTTACARRSRVLPPQPASRRAISGPTPGTTRACSRATCRQRCCSSGTRPASRTTRTSTRPRTTAWRPARCSPARSPSSRAARSRRSPLRAWARPVGRWPHGHPPPPRRARAARAARRARRPASASTRDERIMASQLQVQMNRVAHQQHDTTFHAIADALRPPLGAPLPVRGAHHRARDLRRAPDRRPERRQRLLEARLAARLSARRRRGRANPPDYHGRVSPSRRAALVSLAAAIFLVAIKLVVGARDGQPRRARRGRALGGRLVRRAADAVRGDGRRASGRPQPPVRPRQGPEPRSARRDAAARRGRRLDRRDRDRPPRRLRPARTRRASASRSCCSCWWSTRRAPSSRGARREAEHSAALYANSWHFATDFAGSLAVLIGLVLAALGYPGGDAIAALVVAGDHPGRRGVRSPCATSSR